MDERRKGSEEAGHMLSWTGFINLLPFYPCLIVLRHALTALLHLSSSSLLPLQRPKQSLLSFTSFFFFSILFTCSVSCHSSSSVLIFTLHQHTFHAPTAPLPSFPPLVLRLLLLLYMGNTRKPEKVEYFHPPIRFPLSSLR